MGYKSTSDFDETFFRHTVHSIITNLVTKVLFYISIELCCDKNSEIIFGCTNNGCDIFQVLASLLFNDPIQFVKCISQILP
jgi:hypothetical protein